MATHLHASALLHCLIAAACLRDGRASEPTKWPGAATSDIGHPLVRIGPTLADDARAFLTETMDAFFEVYNARPQKFNRCGVRINHAFGIWLAVKKLQPTTIIE